MGVVISLGGSIAVPDEIDIKFLKRFRELVIDYSKEEKVIIVVGGGKICRTYQSAAGDIAKTDDEDLDWIGIMATRLNAELIRSIFPDSHPQVVYDPTTKFKTDKKIIIAAGYKPGWSTDYDSVLLAKNFGIDTVINMTNVDYVYTKDPKKYKDAEPLEIVSWDQITKMFGDKWSPGANYPFDPIACKEARKSKIKVVILNGNNLSNLKSAMLNKKFRGTIIT